MVAVIDQSVPCGLAVKETVVLFNVVANHFEVFRGASLGHRTLCRVDYSIATVTKGADGVCQCLSIVGVLVENFVDRIDVFTLHHSRQVLPHLMHNGIAALGQLRLSCIALPWERSILTQCV